MPSSLTWPLRVAAGHPRTLAASLAGLAAYPLLPTAWGVALRGVVAWDIGALVLLVLSALLFANEGSGRRMAVNALNQQEGEWTVFALTLGAVLFSFIALTRQLSAAKDANTLARTEDVLLVAGTLLLSWLATHVLFTYRYAHEYYSPAAADPARNGPRTDEKGGSVDAAEVQGGLEFPGEAPPDYWDFMYFALVLGMTFQVSDVQITSKLMRRLAAVHGLLSFLFNTVIVALTVNIAAGLL